MNLVRVQVMSFLIEVGAGKVGDFILARGESRVSIDGFQMSIRCPTSRGQHVIKRQLYCEPLTLREAASFIFQH